MAVTSVNRARKNHRSLASRWTILEKLWNIIIIFESANEINERCKSSFVETNLSMSIADANLFANDRFSNKCRAKRPSELLERDWLRLVKNGAKRHLARHLSVTQRILISKFARYSIDCPSERVKWIPYLRESEKEGSDQERQSHMKYKSILNWMLKIFKLTLQPGADEIINQSPTLSPSKRTFSSSTFLRRMALRDRLNKESENRWPWLSDTWSRWNGELTIFTR